MANRQTFLQRAVNTLVVLSLVPFVASFLGLLHPVGDSLAVIRLQLTLVLLGLSGLAFLVRLRWRWLGLLASVASLLGIIGYSNLLNWSSGGDFRIYQKNLNFRLADAGPVVADILSSNTDAVALQEVSAPLRPILTDLAQRYPNHALCPFHPRVGGVAVLTKAPIEQVVCSEGQGFVAAQIIAPDGLPLWVVSLHLHWPYPYRQSEQIDEILAPLGKLEGRVVVAGDFNMPAWGHSTRQIRKATRTQRTWTPFSTFPRFHPLLPLPIDLVFAPGGGAMQKRPLFGSDHHGVLARVNF